MRYLIPALYAPASKEVSSQEHGRIEAGKTFLKLMIQNNLPSVKTSLR
jgi:hypothetical protein